MSIIKCFECGNEISDIAVACPKCGAPVEKKESSKIDENIKKEEPKVTHQIQQKKKSNDGSIILIITIVIVVIVAVFIIIKNQHHNSINYNLDPKTYKEKVMSVEEIEKSQPTKFLTADGNYNKNFWGDKIKVHGQIINSATVATFKDAVVKVTYYSKTETVLGSDNYTIYEVFPPNSSTKFELKINNYKNVNSIGWDVISATPY